MAFTTETSPKCSDDNEESLTLYKKPTKIINNLLRAYLAEILRLLQHLPTAQTITRCHMVTRIHQVCYCVKGVGQTLGHNMVR